MEDQKSQSIKGLVFDEVPGRLLQELNGLQIPTELKNLGINISLFVPN